MTLPAPYMWLTNGSLALLAVRINLDLPPKQPQRGTCDTRLEVDKLTGIGTPDARHGTVAAQGRIPYQPSRIQQAALLMVASAQVVAVKIFTFRAKRGSHSDS
jgi:hypothetical protein